MSEQVRLPVTADHRERENWASRRRDAKLHIVEIGGLRIEDANRGKAITRAAHAVQDFVEKYHEPKVLAFGGNLIVMHTWHSDSGATYEYTNYDTDGNRRSSTLMGDCTWAYLEASARWNLAQLGTDWQDDESVHRGAAYLKPPRDGNYCSYTPVEFYRYAAWQRAARWGQDNGVEDVHTFACEHDKEDRFQVPKKDAA